MGKLAKSAETSPAERLLAWRRTTPRTEFVPLRKGPCAACKCTTSIKWRPGRGGVTFCNSCGLRFARQAPYPGSPETKKPAKAPRATFTTANESSVPSSRSARSFKASESPHSQQTTRKTPSRKVHQRVVACGFDEFTPESLHSEVMMSGELGLLRYGIDASADTVIGSTLASYTGHSEWKTNPVRPRIENLLNPGEGHTPAPEVQQSTSSSSEFQPSRGGADWAWNSPNTGRLCGPDSEHEGGDQHIPASSPYHFQSRNYPGTMRKSSTNQLPPSADDGLKQRDTASRIEGNHGRKRWKTYNGPILAPSSPTPVEAASKHDAAAAEALLMLDSTPLDAQPTKLRHNSQWIPVNPGVFRVS